MTRRDWDGKTIVLMGGSMGAQQSLALAGLRPERVSAVLVCVPAGADSNGDRHGRKAGYPNWPSSNPDVMKTALYFDTVNFASRVTAPVMAGIGFIDTISPPAGIWTLLNQISAPVEPLAMIESEHDNLTPDKASVCTARQNAILNEIVQGHPYTPSPLTLSLAAGAPQRAQPVQAASGSAPPAAFLCHQVTAMTLTREWYDAGFEQNPGITDDRWQLKARQSGYITEWANPDSAFWNHPVQSPCASGSASPDHVVLTVLSWRPACCTTAAAWEEVVSRAVTNFRAKYADLKRIDLMTVIRGPGNGTCPLPPAANEYIVMPAELDAALAAVAARFPAFVYVAPKFEASSCDAFVGGGPHLTPAGNAEVAQAISAHFAKVQ
jgi:pimeloyl-ACP methyl ester carboxylesterase